MYRSKIDPWFLVVLIIAMAVSGYGAVQSISAGTSNGFSMGIFIALVGVGLPLWVLVGTYYRFEGVELVVRCGPFRWRLPISEIVEVVPTSNPVSSPALSLHRLKLVLRTGRTLLISPREQEKFLSEIESRRVAF